MQATQSDHYPRTMLLSLGWLNGTILAALVVGVLVTPFLNSDAAGAYATITALAGTTAAGTTMLRKLPAVPDEERRAWRLLGVAMLLIAGGLVTFAVLFATTHVGAFGPHDFGLLAGYTAGAIGIARLPHTTGNKMQRLRLLLDGIIGAVAMMTLGWVFLYSKISSALENAPTWDRIVGTAYPAFDTMLLVVVMVVLVRRSTYRFDPRLILFAVGAIFLAGADVTFLLTGAGKSFLEAEPLFPLTLAAVACFVILAVHLDRPIEVRIFAEQPATPVWAMAIPYGAVAAMVIVLIIRVRWLGMSHDDASLLIATIVVAIMVFARQGVAIRENRDFVEGQRDELVASISHELRTPLTALVGFLDLLESGSVEDHERDEMLSIVTEQASYLSSIISDLVMLASDQITMRLDIAPIPLESLAWAAVNSAAIDPGSIHVDAEANVTAYVDRGRVVQALANFLANAARYGGDKIAIVATVDGADLTIEVHDNGPGVPPKYELLIWEKFERGDHRLNATVPGSGIGLAVVRAVAGAHGGASGYRRSNRLGGACFWLRLPGRVQVQKEPRAVPFRSLRGTSKSA
jgi:signal transduction histidine kinase